VVFFIITNWFVFIVQRFLAKILPSLFPFFLFSPFVWFGEEKEFFCHFFPLNKKPHENPPILRIFYESHGAEKFKGRVGFFPPKLVGGDFFKQRRFETFFFLLIIKGGGGFKTRVQNFLGRGRNFCTCFWRGAGLPKVFSIFFLERGANGENFGGGGPKSAGVG